MIESEKDVAPAKISRLDLLVYKLFFWRWKPLLEKRPDLLELFEQQLLGYKRDQILKRETKQHLKRIK